MGKFFKYSQASAVKLNAEPGTYATPLDLPETPSSRIQNGTYKGPQSTYKVPQSTYKVPQTIVTPDATTVQPPTNSPINRAETTTAKAQSVIDQSMTNLLTHDKNNPKIFYEQYLQHIKDNPDDKFIQTPEYRNYVLATWMRESKLNPTVKASDYARTQSEGITQQTAFPSNNKAMYNWGPSVAQQVAAGLRQTRDIYLQANKFLSTHTDVINQGVKWPELASILYLEGSGAKNSQHGLNNRYNEFATTNDKNIFYSTDGNYTRDVLNYSNYLKDHPEVFQSFTVDK